jgi:transposase
VLVSKYGHHLPLHRQSAIYAREGVEIDVSTLADWVGAVAATAMPLVEAVRAHLFAAERIHADDTDRAGAGEGEDSDRAALDLRSR